MEFREGHWANLVYISTLGAAKTAQQIADSWNVSEQELKKDSIKREAERLEQVRFFEETGEKFLAKTDSQAFKTEIKEYFEKRRGKTLARSEFELFTRIMEDTEIRQKAFDIESVTQFYYRDAEEAKKNPLAVFEGLLYALDHVLGHERLDSIEYNKDVFINNLEMLEEERPEILQKI
ncbi:hypothetical protein AQV86_00115 [Nanohaloarchaea archaeon SG9]|nr:hypothetical protein AQV86_00115 [Nanohaloarchaea archaeon SG9]